MCPHQRRWKKCRAVGICQHQRRKSECKECRGASICPHQRIRSQCLGREREKLIGNSPNQVDEEGSLFTINRERANAKERVCVRARARARESERASEGARAREKASPCVWAENFSRR